MNVNVRGKNIDVTPALKDYVEKKITKVTKQFLGINMHKDQMTIGTHQLNDQQKMCVGLGGVQNVP